MHFSKVKHERVISKIVILSKREIGNRDILRPVNGLSAVVSRHLPTSKDINLLNSVEKIEGIFKGLKERAVIIR